MIRLCLDARMLLDGGIGTFLKNIIPFIVQDSSIALTLLHRKEDAHELEGCINSERLVLNSPIYSLKEQMEMWQKIPACDLFWSPHFNIPILPIRAKKRLSTIQDVYHLAYFSKLTLAQKIYSKLFYNAAFVLSKQVVTISTFSAHEINRLAWKPPKNLKVIPLAVSSNFTHISDDLYLNRVRKEYNLPPSFILSVGNLKPHKNLARLCDAFASSGITDHWVIAGKKEGFRTGDEKLFFLIREKKVGEKVHVLGHVKDKDMAALYSMAKFFIFPSLYEGFGLPPLEAMACHCPVIASEAASMPEVCKGAVEYINPCSIESMIRAIRDLSNNLSKQKELIDKGKRLITEYTWKKTADSYLELIHEMCS